MQRRLTNGSRVISKFKKLTFISHREDEAKDQVLEIVESKKGKFRFSKEASQSFAVEQISEHSNRLASRKLMFSQKTSGVVVTTRSVRSPSLGEATDPLSPVLKKFMKKERASP
jgi:hypothetical protein